jgi:hypothetical protein
MPKERKNPKVLVQFTSDQYPDVVEIVQHRAKTEHRSLGQAAALFVREADILIKQGCTCGRSIAKAAVGGQ